MKSKCLGVLLGATILFAFPIPGMSGGIPVFDGANLAQAILQVKNMLDQLKNMTGVRGLGNVIDSAYDIALEIDPDSILKLEGIKPASEHELTGEIADLYDSGNKETAIWLGQSKKSLEQSIGRFSDLLGLVVKVDGSPDQKDVLDLTARIGAEGVMLQNELAKLNMLRSKAVASQAIHDKKIQQMAVESSGELHKVTW